MTTSIPIFRNEINVLEDFRGGVKVARDFAVRGSLSSTWATSCRIRTPSLNHKRFIRFNMFPDRLLDKSAPIVR